MDTMDFLFRVARVLPFMRGYDVVQLINPVFLELRAERLLPIYRFLRRHNRKVFLGAFGMDYYWVKTGLDRQVFRYSDFNIGTEIRMNPDNDRFIAEWLNGPKGKLNRFIADDCNGIICGLYEYDACYRQHFRKRRNSSPSPSTCRKPRHTSPIPKRNGRVFSSAYNANGMLTRGQTSCTKHWWN